MKKDPDSRLLKFGQAVRQQRLKAGLTQEQLADRVNCDVRTIQNIEAGNANLTLKKIYALTESLNILPGELL